MTVRRVAVKDLGRYIGYYISFEYTDGWDDYHVYGYLHGLSDWVNEYGGDPRKVLHVSGERVLPEGYAPHHLGGYAARPDHKVTVRLPGPND